MKFYKENGNVNGKLRLETKDNEIALLTEALAPLGYELDGKSLFKVLGTDEDTDTVIRARVDLVVTDR